MVLYNFGNDIWGTSEVVVFDSKTGEKLKTISLGWEEKVIDLRWNDGKVLPPTKTFS